MTRIVPLAIDASGMLRVHAEQSDTPLEQAPEPKVLFQIANGNHAGNQTAAIDSFRRLVETTGDALGNTLTLIDGIAVIGGGVSEAWPLILPTLVDELSST